jgi:hypothetical protein
MTLQRSTYFWSFPHVRTYRRPLQIWICWLGWSLHSTFSLHTCGSDDRSGG